MASRTSPENELKTYDIILSIFTDIDECLSNNGGCEDVCTNKIVHVDGVTRECSCVNPGHRLSANKITCIGEYCNIQGIGFHLGGLRYGAHIYKRDRQKISEKLAQAKTNIG